MTSNVLHLDLLQFSPDTGVAQRGELVAAAAALKEIDGVAGVGLIEGEAGSDYDLAVWFLLRDFMSLEPFGTDTRYARFLQHEVAPLIRGFGGADVSLEGDLAPSDGTSACLAILGPEEAYDFEVIEALESWARAVDAGASCIGLAVGEKQVYRGIALTFGVTGAVIRPETEPFRGTLVSGAGRVLA